MQPNDNTDLKLAIMEGVRAMLAAVDNVEATTLQSKATPKAKSKHKANTPKVEPKAPLQTDKPKKKVHRDYMVEDLRALYRLADKELLDHISAVRESKQYPGTRVFFVDRTPETKAILAPFLTQRELTEDV